MKYITFVLSFFLVAGCAHTSTTTAPVDIVGLWKGEYRAPTGGPPMRLAFNFIRAGENVGGSMRNENVQSEWTQLEDLKIKGNEISFTSSPQTSRGKITFKYKGMIEGDKIKLAYKVLPGMGMSSSITGGGPSGSQNLSGTYSTRGDMFDTSRKGMDRSEYSEEFTLIRVQ